MKKIILSLICGILICGALPAQGSAQMIEQGSQVTFNYTLSIDGKVIESSEGKEPLSYTQGEGMIIPGLEKALAGLKPEDTKEVTIAPEEAYGLVDDQRIVTLPKASLGENINPEIGMVLQLNTPEGQSIPGKVVDVQEETLTIDLNHPLAGKELTFDVTIVSVE